MDVAGWIEHVDRSGHTLADAADRAGAGAPVPSCPDWTVRDLLAHVGMVHRWAAAHVRDGRSAPVAADHPAPGDTDIVQWFRAGHAELVTALRAAPADLDALTFLADAGAPLDFWARRQAHETTVHSVDAGLACGATPDVDHDFAVDGIAELIEGFFARPRTRLRSDRPVTLRVAPDDADTSWLVSIGPDGCTSERNAGAEGDCAVSGRAADLYLELWNRPPVQPVTATGDASVLDLWRTLARVTWS